MQWLKQTEGWLLQICSEEQVCSEETLVKESYQRFLDCFLCILKCLSSWEILNKQVLKTFSPMPVLTPIQKGHVAKGDRIALTAPPLDHKWSLQYKLLKNKRSASTYPNRYLYLDMKHLSYIKGWNLAVNFDLVLKWYSDMRSSLFLMYNFSCLYLSCPQRSIYFPSFTLKNLRYKSLCFDSSVSFILINIMWLCS